ncbi:MAG TPA: glycosyltransferase family 2 protein [Spirochaetota bacterium]|nr:glycosyltransferase family 2 protein [Spirochaetota bacterium]
MEDIEKSRNPKISVITVVYNSENYIEQTILSVINQRYDNIEYIIIDGASTDRTMDIVAGYRDRISIIMSEKDAGIYDAMNKGLKLATGDYVWFINSGDEIYDENTASNVFNALDGSLYPDVIYGKTALYDKAGGLIKITSVPKRLDRYSFSNGMVVSHQSLIVKKELTEYYDLSYRYVSDHDWIIKILKKSGYNFNTDYILSKYLADGFSGANFRGCWSDRLKIIKKHNSIYFYFKNLYLYIFNRFNRVLKILLNKKTFPIA